MGVVFFFKRAKVATKGRNFEHSKREEKRILLQCRTLTLVVSKWSYFYVLKMIQEKLVIWPVNGDQDLLSIAT